MSTPIEQRKKVRRNKKGKVVEKWQDSRDGGGGSGGGGGEMERGCR